MPKKADYDHEALATLLDKQHGVFSRQQALACGLGPDAVRYRSREGGPWQILLPGVCLSRTGQASEQQQEQATLLYAGPHSVLTGPAALRRHGLGAALHHRTGAPPPRGVMGAPC